MRCLSTPMLSIPALVASCAAIAGSAAILASSAASSAGASAGAAPARAADEPLNPAGFPYVFHLVQARLWDQTVAEGGIYYPPTYDVDRFTHATANPAKLLNVANHFYTDVKGEWYCLRMTVESLAASGVETIFEGTAPVGDTPPDFEGADDELFPHILGGIRPDAVLEVHAVQRAEDGTFLSVRGVTE